MTGSNTPAQAPKRGEWFYGRAAAYSNPDGTNDFTVPQEGGAYLFLFPFDIYTKDLTATISVTLGDQTWRGYPPFLNDREDPLAIEQVRKELVPGPAEFPEPGVGTPAFEKFSLRHSIGARTNTVRVDFIPDPEAAVATEFVELLVGWLRATSGQWWMGQNRGHALRPLRNWFGISAKGERASGFHTFWSYYGGFGIEKPVTHDVFAQSFRAATRGHQVPLSAEALLDAMYHHASGDDRRAVLDAATACEAAVGEEFRRVANRDGHSASAVKRATASNDFTVQLETAAKSLGVGSEFSVEDPTSFAWLEQLRTARGNVAHGGPLMIRDKNGKGHVPDAEDMFAMIDAARIVLGWLRDL